VFVTGHTVGGGGSGALKSGRGVHSSTFQLNLSTFEGIHRLFGFT